VVGKYRKSDEVGAAIRHEFRNGKPCKVRLDHLPELNAPHLVAVVLSTPLNDDVIDL